MKGTLPDRVPGVVDELDAPLLQVLRDGAGELVGAIPRLLARAPPRRRTACSAGPRRSSRGRSPASTSTSSEFERISRSASTSSCGTSSRDAVRRPRERDVQREAARRCRVAALRLDERADLVRRRVDVVATACSPFDGLMRFAPTTWMFSPSFAVSSTRSPSSSAAASSPLPNTACEHALRERRGTRRSSTPARSRSRPRRSRRRRRRPARPTLPSLVSRSARFAADAMPFSRSSLTASSKSPSVSWSARLQSIIPALVASRSCFTSAAEISVIRSPPSVPPPSPPARPSGAGSSARPLPRPRPRLPLRPSPPRRARPAPSARSR